jgi:metallo-beta-lactamase class B
MKNKVIGFGLASILLTSAVALAQSADWSAAHQPYRVMGNIYYVGTKGIGVYLITTPKGHILLDGATEQGAKVVEANIKALGFKLKDVKYLIETHAHFDHVGGTATIKQDTGATFIASAADRAGLEGGIHDGLFNYGKATFTPIKVDRVIADGGKLTLGGTSLTAVITPGHSRGCTAWTMRINDKGKPRTVIFYGSTTTAGNILVNNMIYPNIVSDFRSSFAKLKTIKADVFLTNHPEFADLEGKRALQMAGHTDAFVNAKELPAYVAKSEADFNAELAKQQAASRKGG